MFSKDIADRQMSQLIKTFDPFQQDQSEFFAVRYLKNQTRIQSPAATWSYIHSKDSAK